ncbi:MAG: hypothetical protein M3443_18510 [Actinomycetota bacterium]|nr:hypothetical protein [Actinomycetota bacterium]
MGSERVSGLPLAAGVPGDLFGGLLGVLGVERARSQDSLTRDSRRRT